MIAGQELDAIIATEIFGKSVLWVDVLHAYSPGTEDGFKNMVPEYMKIPVEDMGDGVYLYWTAECGTPTLHAPKEIQRYSTSMKAAWEVWEKLIADGWYPDLITSYGPGHPIYRCELHRGGEGDDDHHVAYADTAPHAV